MENKIKPLHSPLSILLFLLLIALGCLAALYDFPLFFGISLSLNSAFLLLMVWLYGPLYGTVAAALISIFSWFYLGSFEDTLLIIVEMMFVGLWIKYKKKGLFSSVCFFWPIVGIPLTIIQNLFLGMDFLEEVVVSLQYLLNGLLNGLCAEILLTYIPFIRGINRLERARLPFGKILTHTILMAVILPYLLFMIVDSRFAKAKFDQGLTQVMDLKSKHLEDELNKWKPEEFRSLQLHGAAQKGLLKKIVEKQTYGNGFYIYIVDLNNHIYYSNIDGNKSKGKYDVEQYDQVIRLKSNFFHLLPKMNNTENKVNRWSQSKYMSEHKVKEYPFKIIIEVPLSRYYEELLIGFIQKFTILLLFIASAIALSQFFYKSIARALGELADTSTGLPQKLIESKVIEWPSHRINELNLLSNNFKLMSTQLIQMFTNLRKMNEELDDKTKELEASKQKLHQLAYYDSLTHIANRFYFIQHLTELVEVAKEKKRSVAVMFMDLDHFKQINDTLGHDFGDLLLQEVARRLSAIMSGENMVARLGGDEFVIVLYDTTKDEIMRVSERIIQAISEPIMIDTQSLHVGISIGTSVYRKDADNVPALLKNADIAMYASKKIVGSTNSFYEDI